MVPDYDPLPSLKGSAVWALWLYRGNDGNIEGVLLKGPY